MTRRLHVLVVEDDQLVSEVVEAALESSFDTTLAENSADAMRRLLEGGFDLMLLDCTLPGGLDVNLVPQADRLSVPVILMSGDPAKLEQIGNKPRPFVRKPFSLKNLVETVERTLRDVVR